MSFTLGREVLEGRDFAYSTISSVRTNGQVSEASLSDVRVLDQIALASKAINLITGQWFEPVRIRSHFSGSGSKFLNFYGIAPAISIFGAEVADARTSGSRWIDRNPRLSSRSLVQDEIALAHGGTSLALSNGNWPNGSSNIAVDGYFGLVEGPKYIETVMSGTLASGTTTVTLGNSKPGTGVTFPETYGSVQPSKAYDIAFRPRDVVIFIDPSDDLEVARRIINTVDYTTHQITFEAYPETPIRTIGSGTKVVSCGAIPRLIQQACDQIVRDYYDIVDRAWEAGQLKLEKVDNYTWQKFTALEGASILMTELTSNPFINNILYNYAAAGYVNL